MKGFVNYKFEKNCHFFKFEAELNSIYSLEWKRNSSRHESKYLVILSLKDLTGWVLFKIFFNYDTDFKNFNFWFRYKYFRFVPIHWIYFFAIHYWLTHFNSVSHFYTPWKRQKTKGFLTFSGGIEMWHWIKMG